MKQGFPHTWQEALVVKKSLGCVLSNFNAQCGRVDEIHARVTVETKKEETDQEANCVLWYTSGNSPRAIRQFTHYCQHFLGEDTMLSGTGWAVRSRQ